MLSGRIHRNGIGATFWLIWVVTASSITAAHAARLIHSTCSFRVGRAPVDGSTDSRLKPSRLRHAANPQAVANTPKPTDQRMVCVLVANFGSTSTGKLINASMDPRLERAYSRYGATPAFVCRYQ